MNACGHSGRGVVERRDCCCSNSTRSVQYSYSLIGIKSLIGAPMYIRVSRCEQYRRLCDGLRHVHFAMRDCIVILLQRGVSSLDL